MNAGVEIMTGLDTKQATDLLRRGAFRAARAIRSADDTWHLSLIPRTGELSYDLRKYRSPSPRSFRTLDATASAAKQIGFSTVEVQL